MFLWYFLVYPILCIYLLAHKIVEPYNISKYVKCNVYMNVQYYC